MIDWLSCSRPISYTTRRGGATSRCPLTGCVCACRGRRARARAAAQSAQGDGHSRWRSCSRQQERTLPQQQAILGTQPVTFCTAAAAMMNPRATPTPATRVSGRSIHAFVPRRSRRRCDAESAGGSRRALRMRTTNAERSDRDMTRLLQPASERRLHGGGPAKLLVSDTRAVGARWLTWSKRRLRAFVSRTSRGRPSSPCVTLKRSRESPSRRWRRS